MLVIQRPVENFDLTEENIKILFLFFGNTISDEMFLSTVITL